MSIKTKIKHLIQPKKIIYSPVYVIGESELLKGKSIVITGGSSGIGRSIAVLACKYDANVLIVGRNESDLIESCKKAGDNCKYLVMDLTNRIEENFLKKCEQILNGNVTNLVNNAGVYIDYNSLNYSDDEYNKIFELNVRAPFFISQFFVKYCLEKHIAGNILFTSSNRSLMGDDGPYGMSKAAVNNFIEGLAREYVKYGIRVNGIAPGMTASNINHVDVNGDLFSSGCRGERVLLPDEIAQVSCFLMSDISKCITGAIIPCDEGDRLR